MFDPELCPNGSKPGKSAALPLLLSGVFLPLGQRSAATAGGGGRRLSACALRSVPPRGRPVGHSLAPDRRLRPCCDRRYSAMAQLGIAALLIDANFFIVKYIGSAVAMYGNAYGLVTGAKLVLFLMLVGLGAGNFFLVRRLNRDPSTPILRFRRFVEVEFGLAIAALFAASSLTSVPPGIDVTEDRVTWQVYRTQFFGYKAALCGLVVIVAAIQFRRVSAGL
jgi:Copper resistance protein D